MQHVSEARRPRILIVEDDLMILELVSTRLELAGFQTFCSRNGHDGLRRIQDVRPEGMVLDINMRVMDGFAVLSHLRTNGTFYPPTLVLTARNKPEDVKAAISMGARDYLSKPFNDGHLISRVGRLVRRPSSLPEGTMRSPSQYERKRPH